MGSGLYLFIAYAASPFITPYQAFHLFLLLCCPFSIRKLDVTRWLRVSIEVFCTPQVAFREFSKIVEALFVLNSICTTNTEKVKQTQCKKTTKIIQKRLLPLKKSDT